ncbi:MAG: cytidylate kinase-like family protein [Syntrophales bacterium]|nr:cytidylate kinase-like family protein [Syntrophales bacterium]HPL63005.1 cytidylate kinase-like family protein [Syntrophales bacterium]
MEKRTAPSLDKIVEEQIKKWQVSQRKKYKNPIRPVITLSRLFGSGGDALARKVADELKIDFFDHEIINEIAQNAKVSKRIVESLDEQDRSVLDEWVGALGEDHMWSYEYLKHLTNVICAISAHGYAIIVGRGASYILPKEVSLRVLVVAPLEVRVRNTMEEMKVDEKEARRQVLRADADRRAFVQKYYRAELTEPTNYDLVINTENTDLDLAARIIKEEFNSRHWYDYNVRK